MSASFSMRETLEGGNFTWTSAGPTADGDIGNGFCCLRCTYALVACGKGLCCTGVF